MDNSKLIKVFFILLYVVQNCKKDLGELVDNLIIALVLSIKVESRLVMCVLPR
jgi:hypothetical protein